MHYYIDCQLDVGLMALFGQVSQAIAHTIVQRENGLLQAMKMLQEGGMDVKKTAVSLLCNISRYRELHAHIGEL